MQTKSWGSNPAESTTHGYVPTEPTNPTLKRRKLRQVDKTRAKLAAMAAPTPSMEAAGVR